MEKKGGRSSARCKYMPEVRHLDIGFKRETEGVPLLSDCIYICVPGSEGNVNKALTSSPSPTPLSIIATARKKEWKIPITYRKIHTTFTLHTHCKIHTMFTPYILTLYTHTHTVYAYRHAHTIHTARAHIIHSMIHHTHTLHTHAARIHTCSHHTYIHTRHTQMHISIYYQLLSLSSSQQMNRLKGGFACNS